jgi:hypothetical protein
MKFAPVSSTNVSTTSMTMSAAVQRRARMPPVPLRPPPSFITSFTSVLETCSTGTRPARMPRRLDVHVIMDIYNIHKTDLIRNGSPTDRAPTPPHTVVVVAGDPSAQKHADGAGITRNGRHARARATKSLSPVRAAVSGAAPRCDDVWSMSSARGSSPEASSPSLMRIVGSFRQIARRLASSAMINRDIPRVRAQSGS